LRFDDVWDTDDLNAIDDALGRMEISGVTCDSRRVEGGFVFAAFPGAAADGRDFITDAVAKGAAAVIVPDDDQPSPEIEVPVIRERDPRRRYAILAAAIAGQQPQNIAAVTGTNGKTSVAWFARQLLNAAGMPAASVGTLGSLGSAPDGSTVFDLSGALTTPDPVDLHRNLADLKAHGVDHLVLEASSHGIDQRRLDGLQVRAAAFTNLSRDHLDYHLTEDAYLAAKLRLFDTLVIDGGAAVVNMDGRYAEAFASAAERRALTLTRVGEGPENDIVIERLIAAPTGLDVTLSVFGAKRETHLPLVGGFQASNALVALGLAVALGADAGAATTGLAGLKAAPGRMQFCGSHPLGAGVYVDYAHTPDALETVLRAARPHATGRVHVVFGCGGDRDAGKRPQMGKAAADLADMVYVTDDNPRTEDAAEIRRQVMAGCPDANEIGDRAEAIRAAVAGLDGGDVLIVAGKGHESGQIVGKEVIPFVDADVVVQALSEVRL